MSNRRQRLPGTGANWIHLILVCGAAIAAGLYISIHLARHSHLSPTTLHVLMYCIPAALVVIFYVLPAWLIERRHHSQQR